MLDLVNAECALLGASARLLRLVKPGSLTPAQVVRLRDLQRELSEAWLVVFEAHCPSEPEQA